MAAAPLPIGTTLADRFELLELLGAGPFTISYRAKDVLRGDECTIKELAPEGTKRDEQGVLDLTRSGVAAQHLRQRFHEEARRVGRMHLPSVMPVRATFSERGTAYFATDYYPDSTTLESILLIEGRLSAEDADLYLGQLMSTLGGLHEQGVIHRNIKPSNILIAGGRAILIDFSAAREWYADATESHHIYFDSPYAAPEEQSERMNRGPGTDIYGLCATFYHALSGVTPSDHRLPVCAFRSDVNPNVSAALEEGLIPNYMERPHGIDELRRLMEGLAGARKNPMTRARECDKIAHGLRTFRSEPRRCPACSDVLVPPRPIKQKACPVCHDGIVKTRPLSERMCPLCMAGVLRETPNVSPLSICPACCAGRLDIKRKRFFASEKIAVCRQCSATFDLEEGGARLVEPDPAEGAEHPLRTWAEWRELSGRPTSYLSCDTCDAQFDRLEDGRLKQMAPIPTRQRALYPDEWAKLAAGLQLNSGNAECTACRADFHVNGDSVTLLRAYRDPFSFAARHTGRLLKWDDLTWKAAGKESCNPGLICENCPVEFDWDGEAMRLVRTNEPLLRPWVGQSRPIDEWQRIGAGLPLPDQVPEFERDFSQAVVEAYEHGDIPFAVDDGIEVYWKGPAVKLEESGDTLQDAGSGQLLITAEEISFGGLLRRWKSPVGQLLSVTAAENVLTLTLTGEADPMAFEVTPIEFTVHLDHVDKTVELAAFSLAIRLARLKAPAYV